MPHARIFTDSVSFVDISGFRVEGLDVTVTPGWNYVPCDVVVMYGLANPKRTSKQGLLRNALHREHSGPIVVIESSLIGRSFKKRLPAWLSMLRRRPLRPRQIHPYYRLAVGGALGDDADFGARNSPSDRWERVVVECGIHLKPYRQTGDHIVLMGQVPGDASLRGVDVCKWLSATVDDIRRFSDRPITARLHPSTRWGYQQQVREALSTVAGVTVSAVGRALSDDLVGAWACITLSSGSAIDALIEGIPPICLSSASLAYGICSRDISEIENPKQPERQQFLNDLCYSQWSINEMADGTAWRHIWPVVEKALANMGSTTLRTDVREASGENGESVRPETFSRQRRLMRLRNETLDSGAKSEAQWRSSLARWNAVLRVLPKNALALFRRSKALYHLGRYPEAQRDFLQLCQLRPDLVNVHESLARTAEKSGDWQVALGAWNKAVALAPHRMVPLRGLAKAQAFLGLDDEADVSFSTLRQLHPSVPIGLLGAAKIAEKRNDWPRTLAFYDDAWKRFNDADAVRASTSILVRLQRIGEARKIADALKPPAGPALTYLLAALPIHNHLHEWAVMDEIVKRYEDVILTDERLIKTYVNMLVRLGRTHEALKLIDRSSSRNEQAGRDLRTTALIHARRYSDADSSLQGLLDGTSLSNLKSEFLAPLVNAAWEAGGTKSGRRILDRLSIEAPKNRTGTILRLLTPYHRMRLATFDELFSSSPAVDSSVQRSEDVTADIVRELEKSSDSSFSLDLVLQACNGIRSARTNGRRVHLDTSYSLKDSLEVALEIVDAIDNLRPLSLVRLGDGEGVFLPYRPEHAAFASADQTATARVWWGEGSDIAMTEMKRSISEAILKADIVGVPDIHRVCLTLLARSPSDITEGGRSARGILAANDFVRDELNKTQFLTSCHVHQSFSHWGVWNILLQRIGRLSLITCHAKLAEILASGFGVVVETTHLIPPEQRYALGFGAVSGQRHYPDVFDDLRRKLSGVVPGQVFLVAAGALGKIYCMWIRQAGGIAIDIGSTADYWCGYETRSIVDSGTHRSLTGVAERVRQLVSEHERYRRLVAPGLAFAGRIEVTPMLNEMGRLD